MSEKYCLYCTHYTKDGNEEPCNDCLRSFGDKDHFEPKETSNINHPAHYTSHPSGIECIQITQHHDFCIGNAIKYLWRAGLKDSQATVEDLRKAIWYIERKIKLLE